MGQLIEALKSRGKAGGIGLVLVGGYMMFEALAGSLAGDATAVPNALAWVMAGLSLFGIRAAVKK